jgi:hypothetical protein
LKSPKTRSFWFNVIGEKSAANKLAADFSLLGQAHIQIKKFEPPAMRAAISVKHENSLIHLLIPAPKSLTASDSDLHLH